MIEGLLNGGQNGLYCTYGTTCSGKSYTVHGGNGASEAGVLPRTLDTVFNSLQGLHSTRRIRPKGLSGVQELVGEEPNDLTNQFDPLSLLPFREKVLGQKGRPTAPGSGRPNHSSLAEYEHDPTTISVDKNYRYSVWISYLEVYNEKIYDLLDVSEAGTSSAPSKNWSLGGRRVGSTTGPDASAQIGTGAGTVLSRHPLSLQNDSDTAGDPDGQCKYATGLSEHPVHSAEEARALIRRGEQNRAVFGTMANRVSSRSHGVFTIRVVRHHAGEQGANAMYTTSRMSIVDLAGSERMANTQLTDSARMKEAGNINKSLMNLGHCIEKIRSNQNRAQAVLANSAGGESTKAEMVPYNSSKLTSLLKTFFVGEGTTVMIITANPFDGGFYENAQVMKFSANVKDVTRQRQSSAIPRSPTKISLAPPSSRKTPSISSARNTASKRFPSSVSCAGTKPRPTKVPVQTPEVSENEVTIIEERDDEEQDPLVDLLVAKCEELQQRLYLAEQRAAAVEATVRAEMANEMERTLRAMSEMYEKRLEEELILSEQVTNKKLDLLSDLCQDSRQVSGRISGQTSTQESMDLTRDSFRSLDNPSSDKPEILFTPADLTQGPKGEPNHAPQPQPQPQPQAQPQPQPQVSAGPRIASTSSDILAKALDQVRIASNAAPPTTPGRRILPPSIPEVQSPGDPFRLMAVTPDSLAPRGSFGGSPGRPTPQTTGAAFRTSMPSLSDIGGQPEAQHSAQDQETDLTTVEKDEAEEGSGLLDRQSLRALSSKGQPLSQLSQEEVDQKGASNAGDKQAEDSEHSNADEESGSGSDDSEEEEEGEEDDSFDPSLQPSSSADVTPETNSPPKRRSARASTAASTQAATSRFQERKVSGSNGMTSTVSRPSQGEKTTTKPAQKQPKIGSAGVLQSTRPSAAAIKAAASFAPRTPVRSKPSLLDHTRAPSSSSNARPSGAGLKRVKTRSASNGVLSEAGAELANRRPLPTNIDLDLSSDRSLLKPSADSPKKKRRALRSSAVDAEAMAEQLTDA